MSDERDGALELLRQLVADPAARARFRADPTGVAHAAGLPEVARELASRQDDLQALEPRESRSGLAGVLVAAAVEGLALGGLLGDAADAHAAAPDALYRQARATVDQSGDGGGMDDPGATDDAPDADSPDEPDGDTDDPDPPDPPDGDTDVTDDPDPPDPPDEPDDPDGDTDDPDPPDPPDGDTDVTDDPDPPDPPDEPDDPDEEEPDEEEPDEEEPDEEEPDEEEPDEEEPDEDEPDDDEDEDDDEPDDAPDDAPDDEPDDAPDDEPDDAPDDAPDADGDGGPDDDSGDPDSDDGDGDPDSDDGGDAGALDLPSAKAGYPGDDAPQAARAGWMAAAARKRGLPPELPVMAALVESGLRNLPGGDADSVGYFQMRASIWNTGDYAGYADHPERQLDWFLDQAEAVKAQRVARGLPVDEPKSYGEWIADVERPAEQYRGRYQEQLDEAVALLRAVADAPGRGEEAGARAERAVALVRDQLGTPYRWGGSTPETGFDCSGLVQWAYAKVGIELPRVTEDQVNTPGAQHVGRGALLPGDLVFFRDPSGDVHHVGISLGGDRFLHAPHTGDAVKESSLDEPYYRDQFIGGRRIVPAAGGKEDHAVQRLQAITPRSR